LRFDLSQTTGKDSAPFENLLHRRRYPPNKLSFLQTLATFVLRSFTNKHRVGCTGVDASDSREEKRKVLPFINFLHERNVDTQTTAASQAAIKRQKDFGSSVAHAIYIVFSLATASTWSGRTIPAAAAGLHHQLNDIRLWF